ncbi:uncharacterized protein SAMN02745163_00961 [Clostridium cavendishii DSM 21758]|uniref:HD domain-containing protein n=1 Tax=Clostridium cavendishii DSM 21758 TaxID=1121302 RepID=A0A1M6EVW7_9CLOT|nr:HD domain-containing protein [Clostridium cavendishii]SHI89605.1 uncharacterized protein SAMN02745163_00961 [Clostridium cavendishii DSM 21758]
MHRINLLLENVKYKEFLCKLEKLEEGRIFCNHNLQHFLDVSRIAYILCLENKLSVNKEIIYAFGLLHDIGRVLEYEEGIPHDKASKDIAEELLTEADFNKEEIQIISQAILSHRLEKTTGLNNIFLMADKLSRACFNCKAEKLCKWKDEKKNLYIKI